MHVPCIPFSDWVYRVHAGILLSGWSFCTWYTPIRFGYMYPVYLYQVVYHVPGVCLSDWAPCTWYTRIKFRYHVPSISLSDRVLYGWYTLNSLSDMYLVYSYHIGCNVPGIPLSCWVSCT